jgi:rod shape-determining protein MreD
MSRILLIFLAGLIAVVLQGTVLPYLVVPNWRPDMLLLLVLVAGLVEDLPGAVVAALLLGALQDSFCGHSLGLYVSVYLLLVFAVHLLSVHLNIDSVPLLILLIVGGTLVGNLLVVFFLMTLADTASALHMVLPALAERMLANLIGAFFLLFLLFRYQRACGLPAGLSTLKPQRGIYDE